MQYLNQLRHRVSCIRNIPRLSVLEDWPSLQANILQVTRGRSPWSSPQPLPLPDLQTIQFHYVTDQAALYDAVVHNCHVYCLIVLQRMTLQNKIQPVQ